MKSPMQLSLEHLRNSGWTCEKGERWNPFGKVRQDCFWFGDILCYHTQKGIALVQTTSWSNFLARKQKIKFSSHIVGWHKAGGRIFLHGWGDKGLREEEL